MSQLWDKKLKGERKMNKQKIIDILNNIDKLDYEEREIIVKAILLKKNMERELLKLIKGGVD